MKSVYVLWSLVTGLSLVGVRTFGNPFSSQVQYRVEYSGKAGTTLWGSYTQTSHNRSGSRVTEQAIGKLPLTINFTTTKEMIVSANGSTENQTPIMIKIYKHGAECSNSERTDLAGVTSTVVCR